MRAWLICILFFVSCGALRAQQPFLLQPPPGDQLPADSLEEAAFRYRQLYSRGIALYQQGNYAQALDALGKAFYHYRDEESARYYYYALLYSGNDLEAAAFKAQYRQYTFALKPYQRGFERVYVDFGPRISTNTEQAGHIYYGGYGAFFRVSDRVRIWHSVNYLQQDGAAGNIRQGTYFSGLYAYAGRGWSVNPSLHYSYVDFSLKSAETRPVSYTQTERFITYKTTGTEQLQYIYNGNTHFVNVMLPVAKRIGAWTFEVVAGAHYVPSRNSGTYTYAVNGTTDSFRNNRLLGAKVYRDAGSGATGDSSISVLSGQLGAGVNWRPALPGEPLSVHVGAAYMCGDGLNTWGMDACASWKMHPRWWLHAAWASKGALPYSIYQQGVYLNYYNMVKARASLSLQANPLRRLTPLLTYQYEQQEQPGDHTKFVYHSLYLTLNYHL